MDMNHEEELQRSIETNDNTQDGVDATAYRMVFNVLKKETDFELSPAFADQLVSMLNSEIARKEARRDRWWLVLGLLGMVAALIYAFQSVNFSPRVGVFTFISGYWGLIVFGLVLVTALHFVDKYMLRKLHSRHE
jgi:hypothetical protein